jgi:hypothetical protein
MRPSAFLCLLVLVWPLRSGAQQQPTRDTQALTVLAQSLNAAGGVQAAAAVKDFTAAGTIAYNWAGQRVEGSVTFRGLGLDAGGSRLARTVWPTTRSGICFRRA